MDNEIIKQPKPQKYKKHLWRIAVALVAVVAAVGVSFLVKNLQNSSDIKIGDVVITETRLKELTSQADEYKKNSPNALIDEKFVKDMTIMNVALKNKAKEKCNIKPLTSREIYNIAQKTDITDDNAPEIGNFLGEKNSFYYLNQENYAYQKKLEDCLIKDRKILRVSVNYQSEYFSSSETEEEVKKKYEQAKSILRDKFLPLFKKGVSAEEIARNTDLNLLSGFQNEEEYMTKMGNGVAVAANFDRMNAVSGDSGFNPVNVVDDKLIGKVVDLNEVVSKMKVGEHSDVLTTGVGVFAIVRIESENSGDYYDWTEFLEDVKRSNKISYRNKEDTAFAVKGEQIGRVCFAVNHNTWSCQDEEHKTQAKGHWINKPGFYATYDNSFIRSDGVRVWGDNRHLKALILRVNDGTIPVNGISVTSNSAGVNSRDVTSHVTYGGVYNSKQGVPEGDGIAFALGDCVAGGVIHPTIHLPSDYVLVGNVPTYDVGVWNANALGFSTEDVQIRRNVQPPADIPYYPKLGSQTNTQVSVNNGSWKDGEGHLAPVGSSIRFKHEVYGDVYDGSEWDTATLSWNTDAGRRGSKGLSLPQRGLAYTRTESGRSILPSDAGSIICDRISSTINNVQYKKKGVVKDGQQAYEKEYVGTNSTSSSSSRACVYVPYEFELVPCVSSGSNPCGGDVPVEPGSTPSITPDITNTGRTPTPPETQYKITTWDISGAQERFATPSQRSDNNNGNTCSHYTGQYVGATLRNCRVAETGTRSFNSGKTNLSSMIENIPENAELGSRYCVALSVSAYKMNSGESESSQRAKIGQEWRHSAPLCILVVKKPKFQVWGNGIYSRSGIKTSRTNAGGGVFGSWVEFEAIAGGSIQRFTSESTHDKNRLTFRNTTGGIGKWGDWQGRTNSQAIIEKFEARYPRANSGSAGEAVFVQNFTGNSQIGAIDGNNKVAGNTHVIYAGNITISGNIVARNPRSVSISEFQQTIIIADNIFIDPGVTRIDAWLISRNEIRTCNVNKSDVNQNNCGKQLRVNGPIIAQTLSSWRTAGSSFGNLAEPAEVYNQRPDIYMWAKANAMSDSKIITTYTKELPIRL